MTIQETIQRFELKIKLQKGILEGTVNDASYAQTLRTIEKYNQRITELKSL